LTILGLTVPVLTAIGVAGYLGGRAAAEKTTLDHLTSVRASRADQIESSFSQVKTEVEAIAGSEMIIEALRGFGAAFASLAGAEIDDAQREAVTAYYTDTFLPSLNTHSDDPTALEELLPIRPETVFLQYHYLVSNPHPPELRDNLVGAEDPSIYGEIHRELHTDLWEFSDHFAYYDMLLIDPEGNVVYTVSKETDLGTNLIEGPYRKSNLADAFRAAVEAPTSADVTFVDLEFYRPSLNAPTSFVAAPVDDGDARIGVLVFQAPVEAIDSIMTGDRRWRDHGLGDTGETYLVGRDRLLRSNSRFYLEDPDAFINRLKALGTPEVDLQRIRSFGTSILLQRVDSEAAALALAGGTATTLTTDYRGEEVLSSVEPLELPGLDWVVLAEIDAHEAFAPIRAFARTTALSGVALALVVLIVSWIAARRFVEPIVELEEASRRFAEGDDQVHLRVRGDDELGRLTGSFNRMVHAIRRQTSELTRTNQELEGVKSVILRWGPDGAVRFINDFGCGHFRFDRDDLIGKPLVGTIVANDDEARSSIGRMIDEIADDPEKYETDESENRRSDGEVVWTAWRNKPILNPDGSLKEILTIGIDITERRRIERTVDEQRKLLENTLESLTHPFYVVDAEDFSIKVANSAARRLGQGGEATCHALTHRRGTPCDSTEHPCPMVQVKETGRPTVVEHIHFDADDNPRIVEVHGYPVFDEDGTVIQMIEYSLDITKRKEFEEQLKQSEERIRSMVSNMPGVVYRCLMDDNWTMLFISDEIANLSGYPAEDFLGENPVRTFTSIMHPDDVAPIAINAQRAVEARKPYTNEYRVIDRDGETHWVFARGQATYDGDGIPLYLDGTIFDVSDKKALQFELEDAKEAAEAANRAKSAFLANMSHELRTPMNAIIGYSEMLAEEAEDDGLDTMIPDLEKINAAGKHLLALINDILDLSKIEAGRVDLYLERFDLRQMLDEAVSTVTPLVTKSNNELVTEIGKGLGQLRADLTKLRQALFNLLSNAAKFTSEGTVTLSAERQRREDGDWIILAVRDTGIGIPTDKLDHVFEEFSQADDSTTRNFGGTGLGLPISRRFCRMMGGDITVSSTPGQGSTFTIELPSNVDALEAAKGMAELDEREEPPVPVGVHPVLVIDDDPDSRDLLRRTLETDGYVVATAGSGDEGLRLAQELSPALITLDVMMPGMDGWAVLQRLKEDPATAGIPVMMVTISSEREMGSTLGAVEHLTKPVDRDTLRRLAAQYAAPDGGGHALVVDDDKSIRKLFTRALDEDGWSVAEAANGAEALEQVRERRPNIVLLDLMMPVMDGFDFLVEFRSRTDCASTPVIVVTAKDLTDDDRLRLSGGVARIVEKGTLTADDLLEHVHGLVGQPSLARGDGTG
jgi:PAS domain S-box-containing protein